MKSLVALMALDETIRLNDLDTLYAMLSESLSGGALALAKSTMNQVSLLAQLDEISLIKQDGHYQNLLITKVIASMPAMATDFDKANFIYAELSLYLKQQNKSVLKLHQRHGAGFDSLPLHLSLEDSLMTGQQLATLMPPSTKSFCALAPLQGGVKSSYASLTGPLADAMENDDVQVIVLPVESRKHWRIVKITKSFDSKSKHNLQLFDSWSQRSARGIRGIVAELLRKSHINGHEYNIELITATHQQTDGYSCGDYSLAYAHQTAKAHEVPHYVELIDFFEKKGDKGNALRLCTRKLSLQKENGVGYDNSKAQRNSSSQTSHSRKRPRSTANSDIAFTPLLFKPRRSVRIQRQKELSTESYRNTHSNQF